MCCLQIARCIFPAQKRHLLSSRSLRHLPRPWVVTLSFTLNNLWLITYRQAILGIFSWTVLLCSISKIQFFQQEMPINTQKPCIYRDFRSALGRSWTYDLRLKKRTGPVFIRLDIFCPSTFCMDCISSRFCRCTLVRDQRATKCAIPPLTGLFN